MSNSSVRLTTALGSASTASSRIALAPIPHISAFNARLLVIPDRFLAAIARLKPFDLFKATDLEREVPRANFDNP